MMYPRASLRRLVEVKGVGTPPIKGSVPSEPDDGLVPGYSASGQDVWLPREQALFCGPGLVLSAVGARCGKVFLVASGRWGVVANTTVMIPRPGVDARFGWYLLNDEGFWERGSTAQPYVQMAPSLSKLVPFPSLAEQRRIADFLDDQVTRIDNIIAARQQQGDLLDSAREGEAVAMIRGLDVAGPRRESGLDWVGGIPASWHVTTANSGYEVLLGKMLDESRFTGEHPVPYLRNTNVQWDRVDTDDLKVMDIAPDERNRFGLRAGDLLICEGGQPGRAAVWDGSIPEIGFQKALHRARPRDGNDVRWLLNVLRAAVAMNVFAVENGQTTIGHLTGEQLRSFRIPLPDPETQERLLRILDERLNDLSEVRTLLDQSVAYLQELKRSLISAAVSGEFDVSTASGRGVPA